MTIFTLARRAVALLLPVTLLWGAFAGVQAEIQGPANALGFRNANLLHRADPWVYKHTDGYYYYMSTVPEFDRLELRKSRTLSGVGSAAPVVIWNKHASGIMGANIWAPEIHFINNKWYVYFTAGESGNAFNVRLYALENSSADPSAGAWTEAGRIHTAWDSFTLDATSFMHNNLQYLVFAQKDPNIAGNSNLYIARMTDPLHVDTGTQVMLTKPVLSWEQQGPWVNEAPEVIKRNGKIFIAYSASSCDPRYVMGMLSAADTSNLLSAASWSKSATPVFQSNPTANAYGPGHNAFAQSPDGSEDYIIYHAYSDATVNTCFGDQRSMRMQKIGWNTDGSPNLGKPVSAGTVLPPPSGDNRFEAEYAALGGQATVMSYANASRGKDVGNLNDANSYVRFDNVNVPVAGAYAVSMRYATGAGAAASHKLSVNGGAASVVNYPASAGWGSFATAVAHVNLNAGANALTLSFNAGVAEVDYVQVDPIRYEAEAASIVNGGAVNEASASNGAKVGNLNLAGSYVQFNVNVPTAGTYTLAARYDNGSAANSTHAVTLNGGATAYTLNYPYYAGDTWASYRTTSVDVPLNAGNNTVRVAKGIGFAELDRIELRATVRHNTKYRLTNRSSGKVLDNADFGTTDGNNVQQWEDLGNTAQRWFAYDVGNGYWELVNQAGAKALQVAGNTTADGANVDIATYTGAANQQWKPVYVGDGSYKLIARHSGKALDLESALPANGTNVRQWPDNGLDAQKWVLEQAP
ncbi:MULTISPECIES: family 43 glycosylhydrolase [unclassified Janthinobacterium]|uniref:family 43 glycosylhydrolase n=1 Tax=unclassified Janthinobacterium TaxID=2610881 RepID=UPI0003448C3F|nr:MULTISPECIES: family 43 glycosylhydrolase [unclassified Janthinobacterium]MEC5159421.1 GH43 family beta-xylosidase [Janthinobacterium sp. CG_S6]